MNFPVARLTLAALRITLFLSIATALLSSCVVAPGYGYGSGGYVVDYYEPYGPPYGIWGPGYAVGPYREGGHWRGHNGAAHPYRSAPASHGMPSIPSRGPDRGTDGHH